MGIRGRGSSKSGERDDEQRARLRNIRADQRFVLAMQLARLRGFERVPLGTARTAGVRHPRFIPTGASPISNTSAATLRGEKRQGGETAGKEPSI